MKKTAISILIALLTLSMAACSNTKSQPASSDESILKPDETLVESDFDFFGDIDGSDNWTVIYTQDSEDTADTATNYPAFHFVNTYAETYKLTGAYASGWYMPSIAELCDIYQNREAVNDSLQHIYSLDDHAAMNGLETNWYWSSSQAGDQDDYAWFVHYFNGYAGECPKNFTNVHALAVRVF